MAALITFFHGTEASILELTPASENWKDLAFYYPSDKPYFYQVRGNVLVQIAGGDATIVGVGVSLNSKVIGGVKSLIETTDVLHIPPSYEYNVHVLNVNGIVNNEGIINLL